MATDFRKQILDTLARLDKSKYWLSEKLAGSPSSNALYTYLRGESDMSGGNIARILDVLAEEEKRQRR